jgi:tetratricopeptide (TPR) repeat protein
VIFVDILQKDGVRAEKVEALFFRGQLLCDMKNFRQSAQAIEKLLRVYPQHRNREEALSYLGSSYDNLKKYESAVFYHSKIPESHTTPAPIRLVRLLDENPTLAKLRNLNRGQFREGG